MSRKSSLADRLTEGAPLAVLLVLSLLILYQLRAVLILIAMPGSGGRNRHFVIVNLSNPTASNRKSCQKALVSSSHSIRWYPCSNRNDSPDYYPWSLGSGRKTIFCLTTIRQRFNCKV